MKLVPETIDDLVLLVQATFPTFGGVRQPDRSNPLSHWQASKPASFALGVDVRQVVEFVIAKHVHVIAKRKAERTRSINQRKRKRVQRK